MRLLRRALLLSTLATCFAPVGATARASQTPAAQQRNPTAHCNDGTYYYGRKDRRLACAHHRGVSEWLAAPRSASPSPRARAAVRRRAGRAPAGATARCRDGTYTFTRSGNQACSQHRGVATWLRTPPGTRAPGR
jgi:hypothetical protein